MSQSRLLPLRRLERELQLQTTHRGMAVLLQGACAEDGAPLGFSAAGLPSLPAGQQLEVPPPTAGGGHRLEGELANCVHQLLQACSTAHGGGEQLRALAEGSQDSGRPSTTRGADEASRGSAVEGKRSPHLSLAAVVPTLMSAAELPNRSPSFEATLRRRRVGELVHEAAALSSSRSRSGSTPASHSWPAPALPPAWSAPPCAQAAWLLGAWRPGSQPPRWQREQG